MKKEEVKAIVDTHIVRMMNILGVGYWSISVKYEKTDSPYHDREWAASVNVVPDYWAAEITMDPEATDTEEQVLENLAHELLHVVQHPWNVYGDVMHQMARTPAERKIATRMWTFASENSVRNLEGMLRVSGLWDKLMGKED